MSCLSKHSRLWALALVFGYAVSTSSADVGSSADSPADTTKTPGRFLTGQIGSSPRWGSGWLDLATVTDFVKDDRLQLRIGGTAEKVVVRLLPKGESAEMSVGVIGGVVPVPESRVVELVLDTDRKAIKQISVHGGPNPWGKFPLGISNGPATIETAELISRSPQSSGPADTTRAVGTFLAGQIGSSPQWGSGWLDLATVTDFVKGNRLRLRIGGTAKKIVARLLPVGESAETSVGIIGGVVPVPESRVVELVLDMDRKAIKQISVHGGPNPWGKFPLGASNGAATIESAELLAP